MSIAAHPLTPEDSELSPWWLRTVLIVMVLGFAGLIAITSLSYRNAPPIPAQVLDAQGIWTDYFLDPERYGGLKRGLTRKDHV